MAKTSERDIGTLSPFELKDLFIHAAKKSASENDAVMLNAGRGNPNWIATEAREAFFLLGKWGLEEARRDRNETKVGLAGMPQMAGSGKRLTAFLSKNKKQPGATLLKNTFNYGVKKLKFKPDAFAHEMSDAIIGDQYPVPDRMLVHTEKVVHEFLVKEDVRRPQAHGGEVRHLRGGGRHRGHVLYLPNPEGQRRPEQGRHYRPGHADLHALHRVPAHRGVRAAHRQHPVGEVPATSRVSTTGSTPKRRSPSSEDPKIKAFFLVNPSNPASYAIRQKAIDQIVKIVKTKRPDLLILTDDVYGTFVPGFRSLMTDLPHNTILVYSYSKHFGCTGWRLGVVAVHEDNIYDEVIANHPPETKRVCTSGTNRSRRIRRTSGSSTAWSPRAAASA